MQRMYVLLAITAIFLLAVDMAAGATPQADDPPVTFRSDVSLGVSMPKDRGFVISENSVLLKTWYVTCRSDES